MLSRVLIVVALFSLCLYLYGILSTILLNEQNDCEMTYMLEYPQFVVSIQKFSIKNLQKNILTSILSVRDVLNNNNKQL